MANQPPDAQHPGDLQSRLSTQLRFSKELGGEGGPGVDGGEGGTLRPAWCVTGRRIMAFLLDVAIIHIIGRGLSLVAGNYLRPLGEGGWWVAIALAVLYFTVLDSGVTKGRTAGKRLMEIEVRKVSGAFLNPLESFVRFLPIGAMFAAFFFVRGANPYRPLAWALEGAALFLALGIGTFTLAHPRRQSLQDLLARSVVVRSGGFFRFEPAGSGEPAIVFATLVVLILIAAVPLRLFILLGPLGQRLERLSAVLERIPEISSPRVKTSISLDERWRVTAGIVAGAYVRDPVAFADGRKVAALARTIADRLTESKAIPQGTTGLTVELRNGYDIGVWNEMAVVTRAFPIHGAKGVEGVPGSPEKRTIFKSMPGGSRVRFFKERQERLQGGKDKKKDAGPPKPKNPTK